jgi:hypothetical protein
MLRHIALSLIGTLALLASTVSVAHANTPPAGTANLMRNSGYYDHQVIEYVSGTFTADSVQAAQLIALGNVVYHIVDAGGNVPAVQCAQNTAAFPTDSTDCNVLNFIPGELGYAGGAWNLQIFHWNARATITALTKDDDILAQVAAGNGTLQLTNILVRCPLVNFSALR